MESKYLRNYFLTGVQSGLYCVRMKMSVQEAGRLGGEARARAETSEQTRERMSRVALARWHRLGRRERARAMEPAVRAAAKVNRKKNRNGA